MEIDSQLAIDEDKACLLLIKYVHQLCTITQGSREIGNICMNRKTARRLKHTIVKSFIQIYKRTRKILNGTWVRQRQTEAKRRNVAFKQLRRNFRISLDQHHLCPINSVCDKKLFHIISLSQLPPSRLLGCFSIYFDRASSAFFRFLSTSQKGPKLWFDSDA